MEKEKKANTPSKGRSLSLSFFLKRKENRDPLRGFEKEVKNIAWSKGFRPSFFAVVNLTKSANLAYSSQQQQKNTPSKGKILFVRQISQSAPCQAASGRSGK
jgi:hypothetical protein